MSDEKCMKKGCSGKSKKLFTSKALGVTVCEDCYKELMIERIRNAE